jgi:PilZ domain-containing protein
VVNRGSTVPEESNISNLNAIERRVERRISVHVPVEVTELDGEGRQIMEQTFVEDVSYFGCRFSTRGRVQQGDPVAVKLLGPHGNSLSDQNRRLFEIMWVARKENSCMVGARVLQGEKLVNIKFPPQSGGQIRGPK